MTASTTPFESKPCSRCGGSGQYSYCQSHGTRCFGCGGRGWQFTKRGAAAHAMYAESLKTPAGEIVVGQRIRVDGVGGIIPTFWLEVRAIEASVSRSRSGDDVDWTETPAVNLRGVSRRPGVSTWDDEAMLEENGLGCPSHYLVRVAHTADERSAKLAAALAYQETLTLKGEPRKVRA